ncbi:MAG: flagellar basal-body rod protein FlgF [Pirellulales bacterium]
MPVAISGIGRRGALIEAGEAPMPYGLYISAEGAQAQVARMEVIANNLANVDTPGFKRDLALIQARYAEAIEQGLEAPQSGSIDDVGGGVLVAETLTDFSSGALKNTGIPSDLAIDGDGFFAVERDGEMLLTRAGNFQISPTGELLTQDGLSVLDDSGTPIVVSGTWRVGQDGQISDEAGATTLGLFRPESLGDLVKIGENLFRSLSDPQPVPPAQRRVVQNFLEGSGVQPTTEMMELIATQRAFEANTQLIKNQDDMLDSLISRLLKG